MTLTSVPPEWADVNDEMRAVFSEGEQALKTHRQSLERVFKTGRAFASLQQAAMHQSHSNNPIGKRYNEAFARLVRPTPHLAKTNKTDRAQYVWCYEHHERIEAWWSTVAQNQRDRWGHPDTIKKQYLKQHGDEMGAKPKEGAAPALTPSQKKDAELVRLQEELDSANHKIRRLERDHDNGPLLTRTATADEAVRVLREFFGPSKARTIAAAMMRALKSTTPAEPKRRPRSKAEHGAGASDA